MNSMVSDLRWLLADYGLTDFWRLVGAGLSRVMKRFVDLSLAITGLILLAPAMAALAVLIRVDSPGGSIFRQERCGRDGKTFSMLKFRSMRMDAEQVSGPTWATEDDPRVTRLGRFLRKSRLDEIPQLINVISGDMSLVGPRPERPFFVEQLEVKVPNYQLRHSVRPGITGESQIFVGYDTCFEDVIRKVQHDLSYIRNKSFLYDLKLMLLTVKVIFTGHGAH